MKKIITAIMSTMLNRNTLLSFIGPIRLPRPPPAATLPPDPPPHTPTPIPPPPLWLIKLIPADVAETARVFDILLGYNLAGRKDHIAAHGAEYLDELDLS